MIPKIILNLITSRSSTKEQAAKILAAQLAQARQRAAERYVESEIRMSQAVCPLLGRNCITTACIAFTKAESFRNIYPTSSADTKVVICSTARCKLFGSN